MKLTEIWLLEVPLMKTRICWGIMGTGGIAKAFAEALKQSNDAKLLAIGSRTKQSAEDFGVALGIPRRYGSYEEIAADPDIDIMYIATPHPFHKNNTLLSLQAGKAVLCEKPFAINAQEADEMIRYARDKHLFLMEAMWSRFFPLMFEMKKILEEGIIGIPQILTADFGIHPRYDPKGRFFNLALGGGALLDVGVYLVSLASMILGVPSKINSFASFSKTGVDEQSAIILSYPDGQMAILHASLLARTPREATIVGSDGQLRIHSPCWFPNSMSIKGTKKGNKLVELPYEGTGYHYEAEEAMRNIRSNKLESDIMPLDETLQIMQTLDDIRTQWGLHYPSE